MDGSQLTSISAQDLYSLIGTVAAPVVIDVRGSAAIAADNRMIMGAVRQDPGEIQDWRQGLPPGRTVVVYCVHGQKVSQEAVSALRGAGVDARYLEHQIAGWAEHRFPMRNKRDTEPGSWVTRERPRSIGSPVPGRSGALSIQKPNSCLRRPSVFSPLPQKRGPSLTTSLFSHEGELCSFDAFLKIYGIENSALDALALIVRGADTARLELTPQLPGLLAVSLGLSAIYADDQAMLERGMTVYDALYAWYRDCRDQGHDWNPAAMMTRP